MQIATKQNFKLKQIILLFFILFVNCTFSLTLSNINELRELSNFDEIKNIEVEKVIEMKEAVKELERIFISSTMSKGIKIDPKAVE